MEKELFETALGIQKPLYIEQIKFDVEKGQLGININFERGGKFSCSECECTNLPAYDIVSKTWRHLNFFQYDCYIHLRTPRTDCDECGILQWSPPWSRNQSGFTMLFKAFIMTLAREMAVSKIAELIGEHGTNIWRVIKHHTDIAYAKKDLNGVSKVGYDEISSRKGHNYIKVFADIENKEVIYATTGKNANTIKKFTEELPNHNASSEDVTEVTIDMLPAFISGANEYLSNASYRAIKDPEIAEQAIKKWLSWAVRSCIEPVKDFAKMVKNHFDGIMRYFTSPLTSGAMEGINSRIQNIKCRARGFRSMDNFIAMIYLEMANLEFDLPI